MPESSGMPVPELSLVIAIIIDFSHTKNINLQGEVVNTENRPNDANENGAGIAPAPSQCVKKNRPF